LGSERATSSSSALKRGTQAFSSALKSHSIVFPDANLILHHVLEEAEFLSKIEYFLKFMHKYEINCEVLPSVHSEVAKRMLKASQNFLTLIKQCETTIRSRGAPASIGVDMLECIREAFSTIVATLEDEVFKDSRQKQQAIRYARTVETAIVSSMVDRLEHGDTCSIQDFFREVEKETGNTYVTMSNRLALLTSGLKVGWPSAKDLLPVTSELHKVLASCHLPDPDLKMVCQAVSRMAKENKWGALVSLDYVHMLRNAAKIEQETMLSVTEPLYVLLSLERKLSKERFPRKLMDFSKFVQFPSPAGVV